MTQTWRQKLENIPRVHLIEKPTPVRRLDKAFPNREIWLKDDSSSHPIYGGNKPRKLEFLLAELKRRKKGLVTFGFEISNHAMAAAYHCSKHHVPCHLVLVRGPAGHPDVQKKRALLDRFATSTTTVENYRSAARSGMLRWLTSLGRIQIVPPGGSNAIGALGYVRAAVELAEQIERGELPLPEAIVLPLGTGGTVAGLAVGLAACGLPTKVVGVKVVPGAINEMPRLARLARGMRKLLPELPKQSLRLDNLIIERDALGEGYGAATPEGKAVVELLRTREGITAETTYSGKAAAVLERMPGKGPVLFWLTYSEFRG